jgi:SRSO17 transposase
VRTQDQDRCRAAKIPEERDFRTKNDLAKDMVLRALASPPPIAWVTADAAYEQEGRFRRLLEQSGVGYVLAVPKSQFSVGCNRIETLIAQAPDQAWTRLSCGDGAKGPCLYDWAAIRLPAAASASPRRSPTTWPARRSMRPCGTLVRIAGMRWAIEECFQAAKNECGLDQYEVRRYVGWYRHITLAMLAHA